MKREKNTYEKPLCEAVEIGTLEVIATSSNVSNPFDGYNETPIE